MYQCISLMESQMTLGGGGGIVLPKSANSLQMRREMKCCPVERNNTIDGDGSKKAPNRNQLRCWEKLRTLSLVSATLRIECATRLMHVYFCKCACPSPNILWGKIRSLIYSLLRSKSSILRSIVPSNILKQFLRIQ